MTFNGAGPILQYGFGGRVSHVTMAIWDTNPDTGKPELYIVESRGGKDWPADGIQRNPYSVWIDCVTEEEISVVWLPIRDELSEKFDTKKAWAHFHQLEGTPYGWPNIITTWVDTPYDNFPPILDIDFAYTVFMKGESMGYDIISKLMGELLNIKLGTKGLNLAQIAIEAHKQKKSIPSLLAEPEHEGTEYSFGKAYVCSS